MRTLTATANIKGTDKPLSRTHLVFECNPNLPYSLETDTDENGVFTIEKPEGIGIIYPDHSYTNITEQT